MSLLLPLQEMLDLGQNAPDFDLAGEIVESSVDNVLQEVLDGHSAEIWVA